MQTALCYSDLDFHAVLCKRHNSGKGLIGILSFSESGHKGDICVRINALSDT